MANNYKNSKVDLTNTNVTTLYTAPSATTAIVSNDSGSEDTITLTITDSATAVFSVYKLESVGANSTEELLKQPLVVMESEILKVNAATGGRLHVIASYLEVS